MSIPAFGWAMQQGRELRLSTGLRMLLIAIADRQNGDAYCTASQQCLANDTGLTIRRVRDLAPELARLGLIRIEQIGRFLRYQVLRPIAEASSGIRQAKEETISSKQRKPVPQSRGLSTANTGNGTRQYRKSVPRNAEAISDKPSSNQENLKSAREARGADAPNQEGKIAGTEEQNVAAPSLPANAFRPPGNTGPFASRAMHLDAARPEVVTDCDPPQTEEDRQRMAAAFKQLTKAMARGMFSNYPPREAALSTSEMLDAIGERSAMRDVSLKDAQLAAARAALRQRAAP